MATIEDLVRRSLQERADDVEPTPALWQRVQHRLGRRRWRIAAGVVAVGVAGALVGVLVVPGLFASDDPGMPEIADTSPRPLGAALPDTFVTSVAGRLELRDLETGEPLVINSGYAGAEGDPGAAPAHQVAVRPGSTRSDFTVLAAYGGDGEQPGLLEVAAPPAEDPVIEDGLAVGVPISGRVLPPFADEPDFRPSVVWAPDADRAAVSVPAEVNGTALAVWDSPRPEDLQAGDDVLVSAGVGFEAGVELLDWVGSTRDTGDQSTLYYRRGNGTVVALELRATADGGFEPGSSEAVAGQDVDVLDVGVDEGREPSGALLRGGADGPELVWNERWPGGVGVDALSQDTVSIHDLSQLLDPDEPTDVWVDVSGDGMLVGDGHDAWLLVRDDGGFAPPQHLATGVATGMLFADPVASDGGEQIPGPDPADDADDEPAEESDPEPDAGQMVQVELGDGLVTADGADLALVYPDGTREELYTFPSEGHSSIVSVAVRPGSTFDDLTVAMLTTAEGMYDLRWARFVDGAVQGEAAAPQVLEVPEAQLSSGTGLGTVPSPVWSPGGDLLAFLSPLQGGGSELWILGWGEDAPTEDPNRASTVFALGSDVPLRAEQWIWTDGAASDAVARQGQLLVTEVQDSGTWTLDLERQGDGAAALASGDPLEQARPDAIDLGSRNGDAIDTALVDEGDGLGLVLDGRPAIPVPEAVAGPGGQAWLTVGEQLTIVGVGPRAAALTDDGLVDLAELGLGPVSSAGIVR